MYSFAAPNKAGIVLEGKMSNHGEQLLPQARADRLVIEALQHEVLVYDLDRQKAHCLNDAAVLIWNHCDGKTSIKEMSRILSEHSSEQVDEGVVWLGLDRLRRANLLEGRIPQMPGSSEGMSRRQAVKRIGLALSIPLVVSIIAPQASAALSCAGGVCVSDGHCTLPCHCVGSTCQ